MAVALINTVTGAVLHQQVHSGAAGPVHAVVSEHWVVYAFRDVVTMRQQVRHVGSCSGTSAAVVLQHHGGAAGW